MVLPALLEEEQLLVVVERRLAVARLPASVSSLSRPSTSTSTSTNTYTSSSGSPRLSRTSSLRHPICVREPCSAAPWLRRPSRRPSTRSSDKAS